MPWVVRLVEEFEQELRNLEREVRNKLASSAKLLEVYGPQLGRPHVDALKGAKHSNLKELRFKAAGGAWRVAFAFDPVRQAIVLVAGDKSSGSEDRFFKRLIATADARYARHLQDIPIPLAPSARRKTPLDQRHDASIGETHRRHLSC